MRNTIEFILKEFKRIKSPEFLNEVPEKFRILLEEQGEILENYDFIFYGPFKKRSKKFIGVKDEEIRLEEYTEFNGTKYLIATTCKNLLSPIYTVFRSKPRISWL